MNTCIVLHISQEGSLKTLKNKPIPRPQDAAMTSLQKVQAGCCWYIARNEIWLCTMNMSICRFYVELAKMKKLVAAKPRGADLELCVIFSACDKIGHSCDGSALIWLHKSWTYSWSIKIIFTEHRAEIRIFCDLFHVNHLHVNTDPGKTLKHIVL